jgi:hypothetical protein
VRKPAALARFAASELQPKHIGTVSIQVHRRRRIVACVPTQTQGCLPMIVNPKMFLKQRETFAVA